MKSNIKDLAINRFPVIVVQCVLINSNKALHLYIIQTILVTRLQKKKKTVYIIFRFDIQKWLNNIFQAPFTDHQIQL